MKRFFLPAVAFAFFFVFNDYAQAITPEKPEFRKLKGSFPAAR